MPEMLFFKVPKATAEFDGESIKVTLWYPAKDKREYVEGKRLPGAEEFGIECFDKLLTEGHAEIATEQYPLRPSSGGAIDVFDDRAVIVHRRDGFAPTHPLQFSIGGGFPSNEAQFYNLQSLISREASEETLLFGPDDMVFMPDDGGQEVSREMAKKIGIRATESIVRRVRYSLDDLGGPDTLDIRDENGELVCRESGFVTFASDGSRNLNFLRARYWPLIISPSIRPVDTEGMEKPDGSFLHYNRECFVLTCEDLREMRYGQPFVPKRAYKLKDGKPELQQKAPAGMPYIWYQDDMLDCMLRGLGLYGHHEENDKYRNWLERQRAVEIATLRAIQAKDYVSFVQDKGFQPCEPGAKRAVPNVYKFLAD